MTDNHQKDLVLYLNTRSLSLEKDAEINAAKKAGLDLAIAAPSAQPYASYDIQHFIEASLGNYELAQATIINYLKSNNLQIKGLVAWTDKEVELVARLGTALGLPASTPEASRNVRNKANTRRLLDQLKDRIGSVNPKYTIIQNYQLKTFKEALTTVGVPALLKPSGASGGRGIFKINDYKTADQVFQEFVKYCDPQRDEIYGYFQEEFILEENLSGTEHSLAGIVVDNQAIALAIADKKIDRTVAFQYQNVTPSRLSTEIQDRVVEIANSAIKLLGLNWCGFHIDFMVVNEGEIKILEVGGRLGGECINSNLIPLAYQELRPYDLLLQVIQGNNPFTKTNFIYDAVNRSGLRALFPNKPGNIVRLEGLEKVKNHPHTRALVQLKQLNDRVVLPSVQMDGYAVAYVVAQCEHEANIEDILTEIAALVTIETAS